MVAELAERLEAEGPGTGQYLPPGTRVEVRNRFDATWARGFEIVGADDGGYRVRRLSDGAELPTVFADHDVRIERKRTNDMWWY